MAGVLKTRFKTRVDDAARWIPKALRGTLDSFEQNISVGRAACALLEQLQEVMRTHAGNRGELRQAYVPVQTSGNVIYNSLKTIAGQAAFVGDGRDWPQGVPLQ